VRITEYLDYINLSTKDLAKSKDNRYFYIDIYTPEIEIARVNNLYFNDSIQKR